MMRHTSGSYTTLCVESTRCRRWRRRELCFLFHRRGRPERTKTAQYISCKSYKKNTGEYTHGTGRGALIADVIEETSNSRCRKKGVFMYHQTLCEESIVTVPAEGGVQSVDPSQFNQGWNPSIRFHTLALRGDPHGGEEGGDDFVKSGGGTVVDTGEGDGDDILLP